MQFVLVDQPDRVHFYPFSLTRSLTEIRVGIFTIQERWESILNTNCQVYTSPYLQGLYTTTFLDHEDAVVFINVTCIPDESIKNALFNLKEGASLLDEDGKWIATHTSERSLGNILLGDPNLKTTIPAKFIKNATHLLQIQAALIQSDFNQVTANKTSIVVDASNRLISPENIFIEPGAVLSGVSLNATEGPIYIDKNALLMEGVAIRGPFVLGEKAVVKMNACIYGASSVGPFCTIGGEIKIVF